MDDLDKRTRRSAIKQIAVGIALGFLIGFVVGLTVAHHTIERIAAIPLTEGIKT